jgi:hypothetical protein
MYFSFGAPKEKIPKEKVTKSIPPGDLVGSRTQRCWGLAKDWGLGERIEECARKDWDDKDINDKQKEIPNSKFQKS